MKAILPALLLIYMRLSGIQQGILINRKTENLADKLKSNVLLGFTLFMSFMVSKESIGQMHLVE
jgi:hypothetical protein